KNFPNMEPRLSIPTVATPRPPSHTMLTHDTDACQGDRGTRPGKRGNAGGGMALRASRRPSPQHQDPILGVGGLEPPVLAPCGGAFPRARVAPRRFETLGEHAGLDRHMAPDRQIRRPAGITFP